jgi:hypothetical protein
VASGADLNTNPAIQERNTATFRTRRRWRHLQVRVHERQVTSVNNLGTTLATATLAGDTSIR